MLRLDLTAEERDILLGVLENVFSDLRMEIANTDALDYREMLRARKETVNRLLEALRAVEPDA